MDTSASNIDNSRPGLSSIKVTRTLILNQGTPEDKRQELLNYFQETFDHYEQLFETLACSEAWFEKATPLRHPLIFYYGHTAAFFINKLITAKLIPIV